MGLLGREVLTDQQMLERMRSGDERPLGILYNRSLPLVQAHILQNSEKKEDAEDILQDALVILWRNIRKPEFQLTSAFTTYIQSIARNLWLKKLRSGRNLNILPDFDEVRDTDILESLADAQEPEINTLLLNKVMDRLSPVCRQILILFYFEELDTAEIAQKMHFANSDTVKSKKYQCKKKLEEMIRSSFTLDDFME